MPRRKLAVAMKSVTYRINEDLVGIFDLLLLDPVANRTSYGKKSLIVEQLIQRLIDESRDRTGGEPVYINVTDLSDIILQR